MPRSSVLYDELERANRRATRVLVTAMVTTVALMVATLAALVLREEFLAPTLALSVTAGGTAVGILASYLAVRTAPRRALRGADAMELYPGQRPQLTHVFDEVCAAAGLLGAPPTLYLVDDPAPNAFTVGRGRNDSHIVVTTGLLEQLPRYELRAVIAHEVAHIVNGDVRVVTFASAAAGLVSWVAKALLGGAAVTAGAARSRSGPPQLLWPVLVVVALFNALFAPLLARAVRYAVTRNREFLADATASRLLRDPQSMVHALRRIQGSPVHVTAVDPATSHLWFDQPVVARQRGIAYFFAEQFRTHPPMRERIGQLADLNGGTVTTTGPLPPRRGPESDPPADAGLLGEPA